MSKDYQYEAACHIDGCHKDIFGGGLCMTHYQRKRRTGSTADRIIVSTLPCTIPNCDTKRYAGELCQKHYQAKQRHGDPLIQKRVGRTDVVCLVDGCEKPGRTKQLCTNHYANFKYHRTTGRTPTVETYIKAKTQAH